MWKIRALSFPKCIISITKFIWGITIFSKNSSPYYHSLEKGIETILITSGIKKGNRRHILVPIEIKKEVEVVEGTFGIKQEIKEVEIWVVE